MALGKRKTQTQQDLFVVADRLPRSPGHVFYTKLNRLLADEGFDPWIEQLCAPHYAGKQGRPGIPPGTYFRMLLVGYFEGIGSQRGIAWRCADSLSLREFLGVAVGNESPDHSSLSVIRERLPHEIHNEVFLWVLSLVDRRGLVKATTVGVDSTTLEANAAMKSIVSRDTGENWQQYVARLMQAEGVVEAGETPSAEEIRRFDKSRKNKRVSNDEWMCPNDPDARIAKMKDGTTHAAYKAEHVVDLETNIIVAAEIYHADEGDTQTLEDSLNQAQTNLNEAETGAEIRDVAADKGYHSAEVLGDLDEHTPYRTYIPEPARKDNRTWVDKPAGQQAATYANRRRVRGDRSKRLQRLRSERVERTFAHVCETGGARRSWLSGIEKVRKRYLLSAVAHNLSCLMRKLFNMGTPRGLQAFTDLACAAQLTMLLLWRLLLWLFGQYHRPREI